MHLRRSGLPVYLPRQVGNTNSIRIIDQLTSVTDYTITGSFIPIARREFNIPVRMLLPIPNPNAVPVVDRTRPLVLSCASSRERLARVPPIVPSYRRYVPISTRKEVIMVHSVNSKTPTIL